MFLAVPRAFPAGEATVVECDDHGTPVGDPVVTGRFAEYVRGRSGQRWAWPQTARAYPPLLARGVRVTRCHDLRLCHTILAASQYCRPAAMTADPLWGPHAAGARDAALFEWDAGDDALTLEAARGELARQLAAVRTSTHPRRLGLLLAAESAGALAAAEMTWAGLPWRPEVHDAFLRSVLGSRPQDGRRPRLLEESAERLRAVLGRPGLNPDSPAELLAALRRAGLHVDSTSRPALHGIDTPAVRALAEYRAKARLLSSNGWAWQDRWVRGHRFHAHYVPGGVVTGRWAGHGGGVLQLPRQVRGAVIADPGWKLVVADAAQLEPRILAALAGDTAMIEAGASSDLYQGVVERGVVPDRRHAKVAMLGAIYGATTGDSARLMPALAAAFPRAIALVEKAAQAGRSGRLVSTLLGRTSPAPTPQWRELQRRAARTDASAQVRRAAGRAAGDRSRFIRNFVVQGTAAEWALCWLAGTRNALSGMQPPGADLRDGPHLTYFLHDELMVHTPQACAADAARAVRQAAREAGRLLFPGSRATFPVTVDIVDCYADVP